MYIIKKSKKQKKTTVKRKQIQVSKQMQNFIFQQLFLHYLYQVY